MVVNLRLVRVISCCMIRYFVTIRPIRVLCSLVQPSTTFYVVVQIFFFCKESLLFCTVFFSRSPPFYANLCASNEHLFLNFKSSRHRMSMIILIRNAHNPQCRVQQKFAIFKISFKNICM